MAQTSGAMRFLGFVVLVAQQEVGAIDGLRWSVVPTFVTFMASQLAPLQLADALVVSPTPVSQTVDERLKQNSDRMSDVIKGLMDVQTKIDSVEQEVQGKMFDMETLRSFLHSHREESQDELELQVNITHANKTVAELLMQLRNLKEQRAARADEHNREMATIWDALRAQKAKELEEEATIDAIKKEVDQENSSQHDYTAEQGTKDDDQELEEEATIDAVENADQENSSQRDYTAEEVAKDVAQENSSQHDYTAEESTKDVAQENSSQHGQTAEEGAKEVYQLNSSQAAASNTSAGSEVAGSASPGLASGSEPRVSAANKTLQETEDKLNADIEREQNANAAIAKQKDCEQEKAHAAQMELETAKAELTRRHVATEALEKSLREQHSYDAACHDKEEALRQQAEAEQKRLNSARDCAADAEKKAREAEAVLVQQNNELKARLQKAKANVATIQTQVVTTQERHTALETEGKAQLKKLRQVLGALHQKHESIVMELNMRLDHRRATEQAVHDAQAEMQKLQGYLLSGVLAQLRRNNSRFKEELTHAHHQLQVSQAEIVKGQGEIQQHNLTISALRQQTEDYQEQARNITRETLVEIAKARRADDEAKAKAEAATLQAEANMMTDCKAIWKEDHPEVYEELEKCEQVKADLQNANAELTALTSTVQASSAIT